MINDEDLCKIVKLLTGLVQKHALSCLMVGFFFFLSWFLLLFSRIPLCWHHVWFHQPSEDTKLSLWTLWYNACRNTGLMHWLPSMLLGFLQGKLKHQLRCCWVNRDSCHSAQLLRRQIIHPAPEHVFSRGRMHQGDCKHSHLFLFKEVLLSLPPLSSLPGSGPALFSLMIYWASLNSDPCQQDQGVNIILWLQSRDL